MVQQEAAAHSVVAEIQYGKRLVLYGPPHNALAGFLGGAHHVEGQIEYMRKKIRDRAPGLPLAEHIPGRDASLLDGVVPVLGAVPGARDRIIEIRDIARGIDPGPVGFHLLVDENAIVYINAAVAEKPDFRVNTDCNCDNIAECGLATARDDPFDPCRAGKLFDIFSEHQVYAARCKIFSKEPGDLRRMQLLVNQVFSRDQGGSNAPRHHSGSELHPEKARSNDDGALHMRETLVERECITDTAHVMDAR